MGNRPSYSDLQQVIIEFPQYNIILPNKQFNQIIPKSQSIAEQIQEIPAMYAKEDSQLEIIKPLELIFDEYPKCLTYPISQLEAQQQCLTIRTAQHIALQLQQSKSLLIIKGQIFHVDTEKSTYKQCLSCHQVINQFRQRVYCVNCGKSVEVKQHFCLKVSIKDETSQQKLVIFDQNASLLLRLTISEWKQMTQCQREFQSKKLYNLMIKFIVSIPFEEYEHWKVIDYKIL